MFRSYLLFQHRHPKQTRNNGQISIPSCNNQTKGDNRSAINHMFSATQKKDVLSIYTCWHTSVISHHITSHVSPLNCHFSGSQKWGFAGCNVWVTSWIGKTCPAVCREADEGILECTVPRPWSYSEESYFRHDEKVQTEMCW
jgi:hypothetical protein